MVRFYGIDNKIMLLGTAGVTEDGELHLSERAKRRGDRAAQEYYNSNFNKATGKILIAGGFSKELKEAPPTQREAHLIRRYLIDQYAIPKEALLIEDESTDTIENFTKSFEAYPEFFRSIMNNEKRLGLVSHPFHLSRAVDIGRTVLNLPVNWERVLPTSQLDDKESEVAAMKVWQLQKAAMELAA